jgi:uncharacterized protein with HEPN domain
MPAKISDRVRALHIVDALTELDEYLREADLDEFLSNSMLRFACIKQLEIIGEASIYMTPETKARFTGIEWRKMAGLRNILIHEYFAVDAEIVWQILKDDIPVLKTQIHSLLTHLS